MSKHADSDMFDGSNKVSSNSKSRTNSSNYGNEKYSSSPNNVHMNKGSKVAIVIAIIAAVVLIGIFGIHTMNKDNVQNVKVYKVLPKYSWHIKFAGNVGHNNPSNFHMNSGNQAVLQFKNGKMYLNGNTGSSDNSYNYMPTKHTLTFGNSDNVDGDYSNQTYKLVSVNGKKYKFDLTRMSDSNQGQINVPKKDQNKIQMTLTKAGPGSF